MNDKSTRAKIVSRPSIETNESSVLTPVNRARAWYQAGW